MSRYLSELWQFSLWFNPLMYLARRCFRHDQELYCDHLTLKHSSNIDQESYGLDLLSTVAATDSVSLLCSWQSFNQLEERIMNIRTSNSKMSRFPLLSSNAVIVVAWLG